MRFGFDHFPDDREDETRAWTIKKDSTAPEAVEPFTLTLKRNSSRRRHQLAETS